MKIANLMLTTLLVWNNMGFRVYVIKLSMMSKLILIPQNKSFEADNLQTQFDVFSTGLDYVGRNYIWFMWIDCYDVH